MVSSLINIAFVVHSLRAGGIERSVTRLVNGLHPGKYAPVIICLDRTGPAQEWLERDVPIIEIGKRSGNDVGAVHRLADCLRERRVDLVQSHNWGTLLESVVSRKLARTPAHIHAERGTVLGMVEPHGMRHWLRAKVMSFALSRVDEVMSNSNAVAKRVEERCGYDASKIHIVPNGVPEFPKEQRDELRNQVRSRLNLESDAMVVGSVGRLAQVKGFDLAIESMANVATEFPRSHLVLVGDGPEKDSLTGLANQLGIGSRVHLVGRHADVRPWLASFDLYLNSSRSEGMSQSIIEALAAGLPFVVSDVGDSAMMVGHPGMECGLVFPPEDPRRLCDAVKAMFCDARQRMVYGHAAVRCHSECYSESALINAVDALYDGVLRSVTIPNLRNDR